ncbi:hypothetical protein T11_9473 [Trichinella zimbabwensis]|uniref:Uncharacterized protein n=1 Tax=Trichinella zimbabwensis TaxID=268475 RepID=A0A0V1DJY6_9BILA|nr:hypothetical protein T11_9473 [Trichinella zimbabwensis]
MLRIFAFSTKLTVNHLDSSNLWADVVAVLA